MGPEMEKYKKILIRKALQKYPGKILRYVSDKTNWNDCFMVLDLGGKKELAFWFNINEATDCAKVAID